MANETDKLVQDLYKVVQDKKAAIQKAEKPSWETNCAFRYNKENSASTNIQVCGDVDELTFMLGFLFEKKRGFEEAQKFLGVKGKFRWLGYSFEDWSTDIKTRIDKIEITAKKKELQVLEERLDALVSPDMKRQMELAEIQKLLS